MAARIRKGDTVEVLVGKNRGQRGTVIGVDVQRGRVTVERVNLVKRHTKPNAANRQGGIVEKEASIHLSNVALVHGEARTRVGFRNVDGVKRRWDKRNNEAIDD
ncbi:MAG: 50S ribosomal protein L24 [Proteobacteria bacterium]|nr:50S ribosomal protein L24 [Pseudomonadota bacterium]